MTTLGYGVLSVQVIRAKEQMGWIGTGWVIAMVKDKQTIRHRAEVYLPRDTVRRGSLGVSANLAVAPGERGPCPCPAGAEFGANRWERAIFDNLLPKAGLQTQIARLVGWVGSAKTFQPSIV